MSVVAAGRSGRSSSGRRQQRLALAGPLVCRSPRTVRRAGRRQYHPTYLGAALAEAGLRWQLGAGSIGVSPSLLLLSVANRPFRAADSMRVDWSEVDADGGMHALRAWNRPLSPHGCIP